MSAATKSFKMLNHAELAKLTPAQITEYKANFAAQLGAIDEVHAAKQKETYDKLAVVIDGFSAQVGGILGRKDVTLAEVVSFTKQRIVGTLGKLANTDGDNKGKRLTDVDKDKVRGLMLQRAMDIKAGKNGKPISEIAEETGFTTQTISKYKPTDAEVAAGKLNAVEATPATPATTPAATAA